MEYEIEFVGVDTLALYRKVYWHMSLRNRLINLVLFGAAFLWATARYSETGWWIYSILAILYVLMGAWYQFRPWHVAKKAYQSHAKYNNGVILPTTVRFGERIVFQDTNNSTSADYDKIKKIHFIKEGIVMDMRENRLHFSAIDLFTKGSMEELKELLHDKRPDLKILK